MAQVAMRSASISAFAPRNWHIEKQINGDLNRDGRPDAALVLVQNKPPRDDADNPAPRARALVIAQRDGKAWRRAGFNNTLLLGTRDGGAFYGFMETPVTVSIKNGVVIIEQEAGSREITQQTYRFRHDRKLNHFVLIGYDQIDSDRLTGEVKNQSANFLTGRKRTVTMRANSNRAITKNTTLSRTPRFLESVSRVSC